MISMNVTRFRDEMRVEFGKMKRGLQRVTQETVREGFYAAANSSPVLTGYLHHNWGVAVHGEQHKPLQPRVAVYYGNSDGVKQSYPYPTLPRSISKIRWNSRVELYNDTWYAQEANLNSSSPGFSEMAFMVMESYLRTMQATDWMKTHGKIRSG